MTQIAKSPATNQQFIIITIGEHRFALASSYIYSVVNIEKLTPVPLMPAKIAGVVNLRGRIVTVFDSHIILAIAPFRRQQMGLAIKYFQETYLLIIDEAHEIIEAIPEDWQSDNPLWHAVIQEAITIEGGIIPILSIDNIFTN